MGRGEPGAGAVLGLPRQGWPDQAADAACQDQSQSEWSGGAAVARRLRRDGPKGCRTSHGARRLPAGRSAEPGVCNEPQGLNAARRDLEYLMATTLPCPVCRTALTFVTTPAALACPFCRVALRFLNGSVPVGKRVRCSKCRGVFTADTPPP